MEDTSEMIKKIQAIELDIFKAFKSTCERHGLRYFAIGGTCLGAVRHKGFIPWDDDIDVAMPFEDFQKLRALSDTEFGEHYRLFDYRNSKHCINQFFKLHDTRTAFIEELVVPFPDRYTGIWIDIMPIFGLPRSEPAQKKAIKKSDFLLRENYSLRMPFERCSTTLSKLFWIYNIPKRLAFSWNYSSLQQEKLFAQYQFNSSDKILFGWRRTPADVSRDYKNVFSYTDFRDCIEMPFEDTKICCPIDYDHYLSTEFGDYMQLPPEEKRVSNHPSVVIDFDKSYQEYQKAGVKQ